VSSSGTPTSPLQGIVIADHDAPFAHPIQVAAGDNIVLDRTKGTEIAGWLWGIADDGRSGWVPESFLEMTPRGACLLRDYNAIELTVRRGDTLQVHEEVAGFLWVTIEDGRAGWVPAKVVRIAHGAGGTDSPEQRYRFENS
jgi:hypothetical protein